MPIEDWFNITGRGVVVTGFIVTGKVSVNDKVYLLKNDAVLETTVKGIELFRKLIDKAEAGDNVGLLLSDVKRSQIRQGMIVSATLEFE